VDQQRKAQLKEDQFIITTSHGLHWASKNRKSVIVSTSVLLAVIVVGVIVGVVANSRANAAANEFGLAMETYQTGLQTPGQPPLPGSKTFPSAADRAKVANAQFAQVADKYSSTAAGRNARYFQGLTYIEEGQTTQAEATLKQVADGWNKGLASLAKLALADLYRQTGRDQQAVAVYNDLAQHPTDAVPAGQAQLQLAALYASEGKTEQARVIYAQLKDKDAKGPAGLIAAQKLNPSAPPATPQL
jgi:tetratricopeptide (TPR) repeat protein